MKIVCISDTHNRHAELRLPPGDVLIRAGDYSMQGHVAETNAFLSWFAAQPHRHKVFIAGNHDWIFQKRRKKARAMVPEGVIYLEDEGVTLDGVKFWGSPGHADLLRLGVHAWPGHHRLVLGGHPGRHGRADDPRSAKGGDGRRVA